jgi:NAD(P)-dependent dehydrogenase (short-subunit alcohol dehydrogenase family)
VLWVLGERLLLTRPAATMMECDMAGEGNKAPFEDATALIYGGGKGIGQAIGLEFARRGARVAVADIDRSAADATAAAIAAKGGRALAMGCDVTSDASVVEAADRTAAEFGDADIVVNNVGAIISGHPEDIPIAEWQRIVDLNLFSVVRSNAVFIPRMIGRGRGHIVNVGSAAGLFPYATNRMPYVASKAAVIALSESMALYLHPLGVRVSCLCPGPVATAIADGMKTWTENVPFRGAGSQFELKMPVEVAVTLADGMRDGRVLIPSHDKLWDVMRDHIASPDAFIEAANERFARGDAGLPSIDPARWAAASRPAADASEQ